MLKMVWNNLLFVSQIEVWNVAEYYSGSLGIRHSYHNG